MELGNKLKPLLPKIDLISVLTFYVQLQTEKTVTNRLDQLAKKAFDTSPRELATFGFYKDDLALKLTQVVADNAQVWSSAISPGKSVTIVDETYMEDDSVRFTLIPQDYRGIPMKIDTAVMTATIEDPKGAYTIK